MKPVFTFVFFVACAALIYLIFIHKPAKRTPFRGPTDLPHIQGPTKPPPGPQ